MLRSLRDGAKKGWLKFILLGFMALAVGGLVLTDVGGFFRGGISSNVVAKGKNIEIGIMEFDRSLRRILARQQMGPQEAYNLGLVDQVLRNEVQQRILATEARKVGIYPSDETLTAEISKLAEPLAQEGVSKGQALQQALRAQGVTENEFVGALRRDIANGLLTSALISGLNGISPSQAAALYQFENETRIFEGFVINDSAIEKASDPTEENLEKFYQSRKASFAIPETRDITIVTLKPAMIEDKLEITQETLQSYYNDNISDFELPERRTVQQAVLPTQNQAQKIITAIEEDKSSIEEAVNKVEGTDQSYIGENDFSKNALPAELADPVFNAEKGDVLGPVQSALGWHVVRVIKTIPAKTETFDKAKDTIEKDLRRDQLQDQIVEAANKMDDLIASGEDLDNVISEMGLTRETIANINQAGTTKDGTDKLAMYQGDKAQILEVAFDYEENETSPVLEMADGRYVAVHVDTIRPLSYQPLTDVKTRLTNEWKSEQNRLAIKDKTNKVLKEIDGGKSLEEVASENNITIRKYSGLKRGDTPKAPLNLASTRKIFDTEKSDIISIPSENGSIIGRIIEIDLPDTKSASAQEDIAKLQQQYEEYLPQEYLDQYILALSEKYKIKLNSELLRQTYGTISDTN